jgi:hypothetical protein
MCINCPYTVSSNAALILPPPSIILFGKENIPFVLHALVNLIADIP